MGFKIGGFNAYTTSNVLKGSGLSSSAAFEVLIGNIVNGLFANDSVGPIEIAKIGQFAEREYFGKDIYSKTKISLPTPEIYVFYNGKEDTKLVETLKLSDLYIQKCAKMSLEVKVEVININHEKGAEILHKCKSLNEYSLLIHTIRNKENNGNKLEEAIEETINEFIELAQESK